MKLRAGMWVKLPDGALGVVVHFAGAVGGGMAGPEGTADSFNVPEGKVLCHEIDKNGETVMVKHPQYMKFVSKDVLVSVDDLVELPKAEIPTSRLATAV